MPLEFQHDFLPAAYRIWPGGGLLEMEMGARKKGGMYAFQEVSYISVQTDGEYAWNIWMKFLKYGRKWVEVLFPGNKTLPYLITVFSEIVAQCHYFFKSFLSCN